MAAFEIRNLRKSIKEGERIRALFDGVTLDFPSNGLYVIEGESGAGKSTFLHILASMEKADSGQVFYKGEDILKYSQKRGGEYRRDNIGFLFQHHHLDGDLTALENVVIPLLIAGISKEEAIETAKLSFERMSLAPLCDKKASSLSGGEKARVSLLRSLAKNPPVLFCDEPTGALDKKNAEYVMGILKEYAADHLVLIVSHDEKAAKKHADAVFLLANGVIELSEGKLRKDKSVSDKRRKNRPRPFALLSMLYKRKFKKEIKRSAISFSMGLLMFSSILLFFGLIEGGTRFLSDGEDRSLLYLSSKITAKNKVEIEGASVFLTRSTRPEEEEAKELFEKFDSAHIENDYSYFFPTSLPYRQNGYLHESVSFCPIWDISLKDRTRSFLLEGECPSGSSLDYILINEAMAAKLTDPLGAYIETSYESSFESEGKIETVSLSFEFEVLGIVKDFAFLSLPRVFYSFPAFEAKMKETVVGDASVYEAVRNSASDNDISAFSYNVFFSESDAKGIKKFSKEIESKYELSNVLWSSQEGFSSLWKALEIVLIPFLVVEIVLAFFALGAITRSSFVEQRKFLAMLDALGMPNDWRYRYFEDVLAIDSLLATLLAFAISSPLSILFSLCLEMKFGLADLLIVPYSSFMGIPFFLPFLFSVLLVLLLLFAGRIPLYVLSKKSLAKELKDE